MEFVFQMYIALLHQELQMNLTGNISSGDPNEDETIFLAKVVFNLGELALEHFLVVC